MPASRRVVVATADPFPQVAGQGIAELRAAGVDVDVGLLEHEASRLIAPYLKLIRTGRPWIIAKWAMTLDGKIATALGRQPLDLGPRRPRDRPHAPRPGQTRSWSAARRPCATIRC